MRQQGSHLDAKTIKIGMLDGFFIQMGDVEIRDTVARTHQLWHLIEYLITYRHRAISQEELMDALWPEGSIDNPANALKNLVYRVRTTLQAHGFAHAKDMVVYSRGSYRWNNSLPCTVDAEEFERLYKLAVAPGLTVEQRLHRYQEAIAIYKGDFLPGARFESWVAPITARYRSMYFTCVHALLEILTAQHRYNEIEEISRKAIRIDQFEEAAHCSLILSMIRQGKQMQAMTHYNEVTELFFREMGVSPSASMRALYREIAKTTHDIEIDLSIIKEDLKEAEQADGAFYCEYEVFKNLYRLEARTAIRTGQSVYLSLVTVESADHSILELKVQNKMMDSLFDIIQGSLRKGDVYARFSACQYVLMLPSLTLENCAMVMDRIAKRFRHLHRHKNVSVHTKIQPLDPIGL